MAFEVEYTDEFEEWWNSLNEAEQDSVEWSVDLLSSEGPALSRPHVDTLKGCRYPNMKELRVQHEGRPYRVFFAFDPRRMAILLIGGDKTGNKSFYKEMVPRAEAIYAQHLIEIESKKPNENGDHDGKELQSAKGSVRRKANSGGAGGA